MYEWTGRPRPLQRICLKWVISAGTRPHTRPQQLQGQTRKPLSNLLNWNVLMAKVHRNQIHRVSSHDIEFNARLELTLFHAAHEQGLVDRLKLALGLSKRELGITFDYRVPSIVRSRKYKSN